MTDTTNKIITNVVGGELTPLMYGRGDLAVYAKSLAKAENYLMLPQGGGRYRTGSSFVRYTRLNQVAYLIPFQFSDQQSYLIEVTPLKFRFYKNNGVITGNDLIITAMTNANPGVFTTSAAHGLAVGQTVQLSLMNGTNIADGTQFTVNTVPTTTTFTLKTAAGVVFDTTSVGTFVPKGKLNRIYVIGGITQASPGVINVPAHGFSTGDEVFVYGITGMTQLNNKFFLINVVDANNFSLTDIFGNAINTSTYGAYVSGGAVSRVYELTTPYTAADIPNLQYSQNADTMYITNQNYDIRKLVRFGHANWTISTFTRTQDPFSTNNWPKCVAFTDSGRIMYANTPSNPQTVWGSRAPVSGAVAYDDFTTSTGASALATDAFAFTLAPLHGKTDAIQWLTSTNKFTVAGTFSTIRQLYGSTQDQPVTPLSVTAKSIGNYGCAGTLPISAGFALFHVQRASRVLRSIEYDITISDYSTTNRTLVADHLTTTGMSQLVQQQGTPDVIWGLLGDGRFLGLTYEQKEDVSGWSRHFLGGSYVDSNGITQPRGKILSLGVMLRATNTDQLWFVVERVINGQTVRSVEYQTDVPVYPVRADFFTGGANKAADDVAFSNAIFETQKQACHLDMSVEYDGSLIGVNANAAINVSPLSGSAANSVTVTATAPVFDSTMVGREIWDQFDLHGNGGGRFVIDIVVSSTVVTGHTKVAYTTANSPAGQWYLTTMNVSGLNHLEGQTVSVIADGGPDNDIMVVNGAASISVQSSVVFVGYKYRGTMEYLNLDSGGQTGTADAKNRNLIKAAVRFYNTLGTQIGTDYYSMQRLQYRSTGSSLDRPPQPFNGIYMKTYQDKWQEEGKSLIIIQDSAAPSTVLNVDLFFSTTDE